MKSYFHQRNLRHNKRAEEILRKIDSFLDGLYKKEFEDGYNIRELTSIVISSAGIAESTRIIRNNLMKSKKRK
jgi:hypothetical protein